MNIPLMVKIKEQYGSQVRFAHQIGENDTVVSKVVRGWRELSPNKKNTWANALECNPEDIF